MKTDVLFGVVTVQFRLWRKKIKKRLDIPDKAVYIIETVRDIAQPGLARLTGGQKVRSSNLRIPTIFLFFAIQSFMAGFFLYLDFTQRTAGIYSVIPPGIENG